MSLIADLTSRDATRIWSSACAVRTLRDKQELSALAARLEEIKEATKGVALGGALRPNSSHLAFAIKKLEQVRDSDACLCGLYAMDDLFDPKAEEREGNVRIVGTTLTDGKWVDYYTCQCSICNALFRVEEREYHYTWWAWRRA